MITTPHADEPEAIAHLLTAFEAARGEPLSDEDRAIVRAGLTRNLANSAALSAFPLVNGDEPGTIFHAHKGG